MAKPLSLTAIVRRGLLDGLGVEDIAVRNGVDVEDVRDEVAGFRATGDLDLIVMRGRQIWMRERGLW